MFLVLPFLLLVASPPTLVSISHSDCSTVGTTLVGCKPGGTNILTIVGTNFYGNVATMVSVNVGCVTPLALSVNNPTFDTLTCTLAVGAAGSTTADLVVTTNGGSTTATGRTISYGKLLAVLNCMLMV